MLESPTCAAAACNHSSDTAEHSTTCTDAVCSLQRGITSLLTTPATVKSQFCGGMLRKGRPPKQGPSYQGKTTTSELQRNEARAASSEPTHAALNVPGGCQRPAFSCNTRKQQHQGKGQTRQQQEKQACRNSRVQEVWPCLQHRPGRQDPVGPSHTRHTPALPDRPCPCEMTALMLLPSAAASLNKRLSAA